MPSKDLIIDRFTFDAEHDDVKCPHCGHTNNPDAFNEYAYNYDNQEEFAGICPECDEHFMIGVDDEVTRYYGTTRS